MLADCHIHSCYSIDANSSIEDLCTAAIARGLSTIAVTDHLDLDPHDPFYSIVDFDRQAEDIDRARQLFPQLTICWGVEVSYDPRLAPTITQVLSGYELDIILGAVHRVSGHDLSVEQDIVVPKTDAKDLCQTYFHTIAAAARSGLFDVIAHFDLPKRHGLVHWDWDWQLFKEEIRYGLQAITNEGVALEINASGYDQSPLEPYPASDILQEYKTLGGSLVTYGSDSHQPITVGRHHDRVQSIITDLGLQPVWFSHRQLRTR